MNIYDKTSNLEQTKKIRRINPSITKKTATLMLNYKTDEVHRTFMLVVNLYRTSHVSYVFLSRLSQLHHLYLLTPLLSKFHSTPSFYSSFTFLISVHISLILYSPPSIKLYATLL